MLLGLKLGWVRQVTTVPWSEIRLVRLIANDTWDGISQLWLADVRSG